MEATLQDRPSVESVPFEIPYSTNGRKFVLRRMDGPETAEWLSLRLAAWWRQIYIFRKIRNNVFLGAFTAGKESTDEVNTKEEAILSGLEKKGTDDKLFELSAEWLTVTNHLVARALGIHTANDGPFVKQLHEYEKSMILASQDKLNGLDMISIFEKQEREFAAQKALPVKSQPVAGKKLEKKLNKKIKEFVKKNNL
jgi:hypothetical protein